MDVKEIDLLGDEIDSHWYYRAKAAAVLRSLADHPAEEILDIGAGSGFFSKVLLRSTAARRAVCVDTEYSRDWEETHGGKTVAFRRRFDDGTADTVLLMDVLEHVDDELELLCPYVRAAAPGTRFLITVPAFRFLWSAHDVFLEHRRRYTLGGLVDTVRRSGLEPLSGHYFYAAVFPIAAATRLVGRLARQPSAAPKSQLRRMGRGANAILYAMCAAELPVMRFNRLFGLSVFAVFRKPWQES